MLLGYVFCIPLHTKTAEEVVQAYINNIYAKFGGSFKILSDNSTEFKNKLFEQIAKQLGVKYKKYTAPYHPEYIPNARILSPPDEKYLKLFLQALKRVNL